MWWRCGRLVVLLAVAVAVLVVAVLPVVVLWWLYGGSVACVCLVCVLRGVAGVCVCLC